MKISVVSPTIRKGGLNMLAECLMKQTFKDFEWIVVTRCLDFWDQKVTIPHNVTLIWEPKKREGDYYNLNKAWNAALKHCSGELVVNIVDFTWIVPNTLEKFWTNYKANPKSCISGIGHQYKEVVNGKPEGIVWRDPRARTDQGTFYRVYPTEIELCVASFPRQMVFDIGGFDEEFDKYAALSEKEAMYRAEKLGYEMYLDQTQEYRALHHPRLNKEWDKKYKESCIYYDECLKKILSGERLKLGYF